MSSPPEYSAAPPPQQPYAQPAKKGLAVAALVLGILAIVGCLVPLLNIGSIALGLVGLVLGIVAMAKADRPGNGGKKMAVAGTVLSVLAIIGAVVINVVVINAANEQSAAAEASSTQLEREGFALEPAAIGVVSVGL